jgi:flagellar hook-length control protein FliK
MQKTNKRYQEQAGGAVCHPQPGLEPGKYAQLLSKWRNTMINPAINTNTPPASAQRSDATNNSPDGQSTDTFGAVLARQIGEKSAATAPAANTSATKSAKDQAIKAVTDTAPPSQDIALTPDAASVALAVFGKQGIKTSFTNSDDASTSTHKDPALPAAVPDVTTNPMFMPANPILPGNPEIKVAAGVSASTDSGKAILATGSVSGLQIPVYISAAGVKPDPAGVKLDSANVKIDPAGVKIDSAGVKADPAGVKFAQTATDVANTRLANLDTVIKSSSESQKIAELAASQPAPSVQSVITASSLQPNTANNTIAAPVGSNAWPAEFSQKISWMSTQQSQVAELHLNPPDLGPMHVVISVSDNQATALFTSPHSEVRAAIENALPKLRESLADNGIMLGNATVSDQTPRDSGAGNFMNHRANNRAETVRTTESAPVTTPIVATRRHNGIVDTFA